MKILIAALILGAGVTGCRTLPARRNEAAIQLASAATGHSDEMPNELQEIVFMKCLQYMAHRLGSDLDVRGEFFRDGIVIASREIACANTGMAAKQVIRYRITHVAKHGNQYSVVVQFGEMGSFHAFKFIKVDKAWVVLKHRVALGD